MIYPNILYTDHYQIAMAIAQWRSDREHKDGAMEFFCRSMPPTRRYLVFAGLHRIVELIRSISFDGDFMAYCQSHEVLGPIVRQWPGFFKWAKEQQFTSLTVMAMREGEIFFPHEPVLRISGKVILLQMIETAILAILNHDVNVASKAARIADVAQGKRLYEFGMRRTGLFDAPFAASAAMAAGFHATSNVPAGHYLNLPTVGTMAHSYVQGYGPEGEFKAFCDFLTTYRYGASLLVDTYDIKIGTLNAIAAAKAVKVPLHGVRLDSGDPKVTVPMVRELLDYHGFSATQIIVSNDMDEYKIAALPSDVLAKINAFGVGTQVVQPSDCTSLGFVGKLVETGTYANGDATIKVSQDPAKTTWPGRKQINRRFKLDPDSKMYFMADDTIGGESEFFSSTTHYYSAGKSDLDIAKEQKKEEGFSRLLESVSVTTKAASLFSATTTAATFRSRQLTLPPTLRQITPRQPDEEYPVRFSKQLFDKREAAIKTVNDALTKQRERYKL